MSGYRTIPTKDTFDVDERLGGLVTVRQLAFAIVAFALTYLTYAVSATFLSPADAVLPTVAVFFVCMLFTFGGMDRWLSLRLKYYFSDSSRLEHKPEALRNIRTVEEDKIITLDGRALALLRVTPINFPLLSDEAKEGRVGAFEMYLRQLVYPIVHMVQSEPVDVEEYAETLLRKARAARKIGISGAEDYADAHVRFLREFLRSSRSRAKNHYVVLQVQDPRYKGTHPDIEPTLGDKVMKYARVVLTEVQPAGILSGGSILAKPDNYVMLDLAGSRVLFKNPGRMPPSPPARSRQMGRILQFESKVAMLRWARTVHASYYYGTIDPDTELKREFMSMSLREREGEFSLDERRRNVQLSAGKTRWAYDELEKHIAVLSEKLEATGLRVRRLRGEELFTGRHMVMAQAHSVKVSPHRLMVDNIYYKVIYATGYPYQVSLGWLTNIVDGREDYDLTMYIYPVSIPEALSTFRGAILKLSTEKKARSDFLDPETEQHLDDVKSFFTQIVSGKERYFLSSLYITCKAPSKKNLETVVEKCKSDLSGASIDYGVADYDMARAVYTTRLTGSDLLNKKREFPSSSLAATFPHISSSVEIDPEGIFFGFDWMGAPIILDLTRLPNQHIAITGESGSGKSYFAKSLIPRYLLNGYRVFVTDPDGEYTDLARHFGGAVSTVGPKYDTTINPFDLSGRDINDRIRSLMGFMAIIAGSLTKYQEGILSDALVELYEGSARHEHGKSQLTMSDFAAVLNRHLSRTRDEQMRHDLQFLLIAIRPFLHGNLYGFLDRPTTVKLDSRFHVFDLREYQNDKTLRDLFNYIIFDFITHQLLSGRDRKALFMDEGWTMVNYPSTEDYVRYIIKDSRKYNVSFVFLTQELEDMLQSQAGRSILNNTATQFIFHQKENAMALMKTTMNLTTPEYEKLLACGKGEGLMISDKCRLLFRVRTNQAEHALISTDPNERRRAEAARAGRPAMQKERREGTVEVHEVPIAQPAPAPLVLPNPDATTKEAGAASASYSAPPPRPEQDYEFQPPDAARAKAPKVPVLKLVEEDHILKSTAPPPKQYAPSVPLAVSHGLVTPREALKLLQKAADRITGGGKKERKRKKGGKAAKKKKK